jgi:hypothetical protein
LPSRSSCAPAFSVPTPPGPPPWSRLTTTRRTAAATRPPSPSPSRRRGLAGWCSGSTTRRARTPRRSCRRRCAGSTTRTPTSPPRSFASSFTTASSTYVRTNSLRAVPGFLIVLPCFLLPTCDAHARTRQDAVFSWTLRAGLRRLGAPGPRRRPQVGAGRRPEPVAARLQRHRGDQADGGGGVPRDRLLCGHPGPRRAGQPRPGRRAYLPGAHRPPRQRRELLLRSGGRREHPGPERHLRHDARRVRAPRLHRARDRRAPRSVCSLQFCTMSADSSSLA